MLSLRLAMLTVGFLLLATIPLPSQGIRGKSCDLPSSWSGRWFEYGERDDITVTGKNVTHKGHCVMKKGDKYIFKDTKLQCYRCAVMHQQHENVLQYKESFCESTPGRRGPMELCYTITADSPLKSMFRLDATPVKCPVHGTFQFSYSRGHGLCDYPKSSISQCSDSSKLVFRYQACADIKGSESTVESVECVAHWKEGSTYYFLGLISHSHVTQHDYEERFRCFAYQEIYEGFLISQSGDAQCTLHSAKEGDRTMTLKREHNHEKQCNLPPWMLIHHHTFHSLNGATRYHFNSLGTSLTITNHEQDRFNSKKKKYKCNTIEEDTGNFTRIIMQVHFECESGFVCLEAVRKSDSIMTVRLGRLSRNQEEACNRHLFFDNSIQPVTIVSGKHGHSQRCPLVGKYLIQQQQQSRNVDENGGQCLPDHLIFGCSGEATFNAQFSTTCGKEKRNLVAAVENNLTSYTCLGGWQEPLDVSTSTPLRKDDQVLAYTSHLDEHQQLHSSGVLGQLQQQQQLQQEEAKQRYIQYVVVVSQQDKTNDEMAKRFCARITMGTDNSVSLTADDEDCPNSDNERSKKLSWNFNLTRTSECAQALATANDANSHSNLTTNLMLLLLFFVHITLKAFK